MTSNILSIEALSKSFGELQVIKDLDLTVCENSVFGFIGKNGAGKTTTMKMILGMLKPDRGAISICGESVRFGHTAANRWVGYLPDVPEFYGYMSSLEYLRLCGEMSGLPGMQITKRISELLPLVGLDGAAKRKVRAFSRGMKQRLGIAQALLHEPRLLICDEPTSALDPVGRREILDILTAVKEKTTIIFSTHILSDVERICDRIGILDQGKIQLEGKLSDLKDNYRRDTLLFEVYPSDKVPEFEKRLAELIGVSAVEQKSLVFTITTANLPATSMDVVRLLSEYGIQLLRFEVEEPELEQLFMEVIRQ